MKAMRAALKNMKDKPNSQAVDSKSLAMHGDRAPELEGASDVDDVVPHGTPGVNPHEDMIKQIMAILQQSQSPLGKIASAPPAPQDTPMNIGKVHKGFGKKKI